MKTADLLTALGAVERCETCKKPAPVCICDRLPEPRLRPRVHVTVLQHPQEQDVVLGTVDLLTRALEGCSVRVGLSWPSLAKAVGEDDVDPVRCAVLFPTERPADLPEKVRARSVLVLDRGAKSVLASDSIDRIIVLDGTWRQAKTLWWRNPWLLKLARISLVPSGPSAYGRLRKEPRPTWVSSLESVADTLVGLGEPPETGEALRRVLRTLTQRVRDYSGLPAGPQVRRE